MKPHKKITVNLPTELLNKAKKSTGEGITETLRIGLELLAASSFYDKALAKKGKIKFGISLKELRED